MIRLSDDELRIVMDGAKPLPPSTRKAFMEAIAQELAGLGDRLGPGSVARVVRLVQRSYFDPPLDLGDDAA
jgi:hypothetical protein